MVVVDDGEKRGHGGKVVVRRLALQQLDDGTPHTPDIRRRAGAGKLDDLGRHPVRSADNLGLLVLSSSESACRDSKIREFDLAVLGRENIGSFDIPMNDSLVMKVLQALQDLGRVDAD